MDSHYIKQIILTLLLVSCTSNDEAPGTKPDVPIGFVSLLGGTLNDGAKSVVKSSDGGYAILGYTQSSDGDLTNKVDTSFDYWLLKFDNNHNLQWQKTYGGSNEDRGNKILQTKDNNYMLLGFSKSNNNDVSLNNGLSDFWITKIDALGTIIWEKSFGFNGADNGISMIETNDCGFLLTGILDVTASNGQGNSKSNALKHAGGDSWVIKLNKNGEKEWSKFYGGSFTDTPYSVIETSENEFIIAGASDSNDVDIKNPKGAYDFWIIKISNIGTLIWEKSFGGTQIDEAKSIIKTNDGNYIIVGNTRSNNKDVSNNKGGADIWLIKITSNGTLIWEKNFGGTSFDRAESIKNANDGGFIILGNSRSSDGDASKNNGQNDAWLLKLDNNANLEWQKSIGGSNIDQAFDAVELDNQTILVVGESNSTTIETKENKGFTDALIFTIKQQ